MSLTNSSYVYTGPWINHSRNFVVGATITLKTRDAAFLLALLTLVVTIAGSSFWKIVSYISHQARSNPNIPHDAIFLQQQAILKNSSSALSAAWAFTRVSFSWRKHERTKWRGSHTFIFVVVALLIAAAFGVASIFSSRVTASGGAEFLLKSPNCGFWNTTLADPAVASVKQLNDTYSAAAYSKTCYEADSSSNVQCSTFIKSHIPWSAASTDVCPFANQTCSGRAKSYEMDSGPMDSHGILGINAKPSERITIRKVATCANIADSPFYTVINQTYGSAEGAGTDRVIQLFMGPLKYQGENITNYTFQYNVHLAGLGVGYGLE